MCKISLTLIALLAMAGCSSLSPGTNPALAQVAVQYATLKVIEESDRITPDGVIRYTEFARGLIDRDVMLDPERVAAEIMRALDTEALSPADRLLAQALVLQIEAQLGELDLLDPGTRLSLLAVLGWIEQAARMAL